VAVCQVTTGASGHDFSFPKERWLRERAPFDTPPARKCMVTLDVSS